MNDSRLSASTHAGAVRVSLRGPHSPADVWGALHDVGRVAQWFGQLDQSWQAGRSARVDFGDGDFFDIEVREVVAGESIAFDWRFLGVGAVARVRWRVIAVPDGAEVTVDDVQSDRTPAEGDELLAGWTDFVERLSRYLSTGRRSRYGIRDDIDGAVTVTGRAERLVAADIIHRWLPIATDGFVPRWFFVVDGDGPRRFPIAGWRPEPAGVRFAVEVPGATRTTDAEVQVRPIGDREWRLSIRHTGWSRLGLPDRPARSLRRRFTAAWVAALHDARDADTSD